MIKASALSQVPLFASLNADQLAALVDKLTLRSCQEGEVVFQQGEAGSTMFVVHRGEVDLWMALPESKRAHLGTLREGEFFGELSLLDGKERTATATAAQGTELLSLSRADFQDLLRRHFGLAIGVMQVLSERLRQTDTDLSGAIAMLKRDSSWRVGESVSVCPPLALLDRLRNEIGGLDPSIVALIGLQHLMGSTATLVRALAASSLAPDAVFLLGKPYSTNPEVMEFLRREGYYVHPQSAHQSPDRPHDEALHGRILELLRECKRRMQESVSERPGRIVLIDDGGHAIEALHAPEFDNFIDRFVCVEQTRSGIRRIEKFELRVPVINVAESWVKLEHESPLIAESVKIELFRELVAIESGGIRLGRNALIIGYGAIGRRVAARLRGCGFVVSVFDPSQILRDLAIQEGFAEATELRGILPGAELVVGCTGTAVLDLPDYGQIADGAILVSTSSSDIEFKAWQLRARGTALGIPRTWNRIKIDGAGNAAAGASIWGGTGHPCFDLYRVPVDGKSFYLVHGGFPVNFNGASDPIPPRLIQLTRALLYAGAIQASQSRIPGLHPLSESSQDLVVMGYDQCSATE
jgi:CRP-like cAMP-binding protein/S-adenosylhomocysteine hydrolase